VLFACMVSFDQKRGLDRRTAQRQPNSDANCNEQPRRSQPASQYSDGSSSVVDERSASVMIQTVSPVLGSVYEERSRNP